jgi:hypothetical protein
MKAFLPTALRPTDTHRVKLPSDLGGSVIELPKCVLSFQESADQNVWDWANNEAMNNGKPLVDWEGAAMFAELAVVNILKADGWLAYWSECYGGTTVFLDRMPNLSKGTKSAKLKPFGVTIDHAKVELIERIRRNCRTPNYSCLDVIAWKDCHTIFVELKNNGRGKSGRRARDNLTKPQMRFIDSALKLGRTTDSFLVAEWQFPPS